MRRGLVRVPSISYSSEWAVTCSSDDGGIHLETRQCGDIIVLLWEGYIYISLLFVEYTIVYE